MPGTKDNIKKVSKKFSCDLCKATFLGKRGLSHHVSKVHQTRKTHCCQYCEKSFTMEGNLKSHIKLYHKVGIELHQPENIDQAECSKGKGKDL